MTSATAQNTGLFPLRQRTGTAAFHMSTKAVGMGLSDLEKLTAKEGVMLVAKMLWGSAKVMPCPHCGTIDSHYWRLKELRWKCAGCDKGFSVTSGTVLADRKLPLLTILKIAYLWSTGASGKPSLQLRRDYNVSYPTMFCLAHKLREGLLRGHNEGIMCGVVEMDGMDVLGRGYKEKRNRVARKSVRGKPAIPEHLLKPEDDDELFGPPLPPKFGKAEKQHPDRRVMISMRQRSVSKGL
ncbi:MAG: transposase, partial [Herminiimonas sp.]|nr:transposase [Herminiimonas sp.]